METADGCPDGWMDGWNGRAEVDTVAVAEFPLHVCRHPVIVGPGGATLKRISAENAVRITIPSEKDVVAQQQQQQQQQKQQKQSSASVDKNFVLQVCISLLLASLFESISLWSVVERTRGRGLVCRISAACTRDGRAGSHLEKYGRSKELAPRNSRVFSRPRYRGGGSAASRLVTGVGAPRNSRVFSRPRYTIQGWRLRSFPPHQFRPAFLP